MIPDAIIEQPQEGKFGKDLEEMTEAMKSKENANAKWLSEFIRRLEKEEKQR